MKSTIKLMVFFILIFIFPSTIFPQTSLLTRPDITPAVFGRVYSPEDDGIHPAVIVLHGAGGLNQDEHQYALRLKAAGYVVLVIDLYAETGNAPAGSAKRFELWETWQKILMNGVAYLKELANVNQNAIGVVGFSRGAWIALTTIPILSELKVIINYYGVGRQSLDSTGIIPPVLLLYGEQDNYADSAFIQATYRILRGRNEKVKLVIYPAAGHGFNFYPERSAANKRATADAYEQTLAFLKNFLEP